MEAKVELVVLWGLLHFASINGIDAHRHGSGFASYIQLTLTLATVLPSVFVTSPRAP